MSLPELRAVVEAEQRGGRSKRKEYRRRTKSELLRASSILFEERDQVALVLRRRWLGRVAAAAVGAFLAGLALGVVLAPLVR